MNICEFGRSEYPQNQIVPNKLYMQAQSLDRNQFVHGCCFIAHEESPSLITRIINAYKQAIKDLSQWFYRKGWIIAHYVTASLLGEPCATISSAVRRIFGWKSAWKKHGFYDAGDESNLKELQEKIEQETKQNGLHYNPSIPVLLFHAVHSSPDIWLPWASELEKARQKDEIGHVVTLQLPDEMEARMKVVRNTIAEVAKIYKSILNFDMPVDLIGHSRGGYAAHLAAFSSETIYAEGKERRWHCTDERNPLVRKVISLAAPTWLCSESQMDGNSNSAELYPENLEFSPLQREGIQHTHDNIYDIVATEDAISPTESPLPQNNVYKVKHGHLGVVICKDVCRLTIKLLSEREYTHPNSI